MKAEREAVLESTHSKAEGGVLVKPRIEIPKSVSSSSSSDLGPKAPEAPKPPTIVSPSISPSASKGSYGIEQAVALLESLPQGGRNRDLVFQVVKKTLQSLNVEIPAIVADAQAKEQALEGRLKGLDDEIAEFEARIKAKRREAQTLKKEHLQIQQVRQHLEQAERRSSGSLPKQSASGPSKPSMVVSGSKPASPGLIGTVFKGLGLMFVGLFAAFGKLGRKPQPQQPTPALPAPTPAPPPPAAPASPNTSEPAPPAN